MYTTNLRKVGGSAMLAVPPALLNILGLKAGSTVGMTVDRGRLIVETRPHYTMKELLSQCDPKARLSGEEREWLSGPPAGDEIL